MSRWLSCFPHMLSVTLIHGIQVKTNDGLACFMLTREAIDDLWEL